MWSTKETQRGWRMTPHILHGNIARFADDRVNLHQDRVQKYRDQVNALRDRLAAKIADDPNFDLVKMVHSGSVAKGTALSTVNDMDVAVYVRKAAAPTDEEKLLHWLADKLREANPQMNPDQFSLGTHCVTVSFRGSGLDVDVVPVLYEGAHDDRGNLLNRETGEWLETSIPLHLEFIRSRKRIVPKHFSQVIRLLKWWARLQKTSRSGFRFKSFMIELLCAHLLDMRKRFDDYPLALQSFFAYVVQSSLNERIAFNDYYQPSKLPKADGAPIQIFDPVNPDNNVAGTYTDSERKVIVEASYDALDALSEAHHSDTKGRAVDLWKEVLGPSFGV